MGTPKKTKEIKLEGYIAPADWDDEDRITAVSIQTEDDEYLVKMDKLGEELLDYINEDVEATGIVMKDRNGTYYIQLSDYVLLEDEFDDEMEDEEAFLAEEDDWDDDDDDSDDDDDGYKPRI